MVLKKYGAVSGNSSHYSQDDQKEVDDKDQVLNGQVFWAAADGNLSELIRLNTTG
jgi:hypothetical protein